MSETDSKRGWPVQLTGFFEQPLSSIPATIIVLGILIFVALIIVGVAAIVWLLVDLFSGDQKRAADATKVALPVLAGVFGLPLIIWRLIILDRQTKISEEKTQIDRETHYTSIFSRSIDQLGQTREIKKTTHDDETGSLDSTTTVPNIEVRIGGIHSLSRLAEESIRDREKIGNVLRSYIRENSWSDRRGEIAERLDWHKTATWSLNFLQSTQIGANEIKAKQDWKEAYEKKSLELDIWAKTIPETRVDVNEATEALLVATPNSKSKQVLYECLFVGRQFSAELLEMVDFRRCTFIKCLFFMGNHSIEIDESVLYGGALVAAKGEVTIRDSKIENVWLRTSGQVHLSDCETSSLRIAGNPPLIDLTETILYRLRIVGRRQEKSTTNLNLAGSAILSSVISNLTLSPDSDLEEVLGISDTTLAKSNLEAITKMNQWTLNCLVADRETVHPAKLERPSSWPI